jgi:hypothetical protein
MQRVVVLGLAWLTCCGLAVRRLRLLSLRPRLMTLKLIAPCWALSFGTIPLAWRWMLLVASGV